MNDRSEMPARVQWTTRRADGEEMFDEYGGMVSDDEAGALDHIDQEAASSGTRWNNVTDDEPIEYVLERWELVETRTISVRPSEGRRRFYGEDDPT